MLHRRTTRPPVFTGSERLHDVRASAPVRSLHPLLLVSPFAVSIRPDKSPASRTGAKLPARPCWSSYVEDDQIALTLRA